MSGAHDWPLLYSVPRWRQEEEASAPSLLWQEDLLEKKMKNLRKKFRQIVTVSLCQLIRGFGHIALLGAQLATAPVYVLFEM
jgi:hypothetical protein